MNYNIRSNARGQYNHSSGESEGNGHVGIGLLILLLETERLYLGGVESVGEFSTVSKSQQREPDRSDYLSVWSKNAKTEQAEKLLRHAPKRENQNNSRQKRDDEAVDWWWASYRQSAGWYFPEPNQEGGEK